MIVSTLSSGTPAQFLLTEEAVLDGIELDMRRGAYQVDYAGLTVTVHAPEGEFEARLFVATLGATSYTDVEASRGQDLRSWLASRVRCVCRTDRARPSFGALRPWWFPTI